MGSRYLVLQRHRSGILLSLFAITALSGILLYITVCHFPPAQIAALCLLKVNLNKKNLQKYVRGSDKEAPLRCKRTTLRTLPPPQRGHCDGAQLALRHIVFEIRY